jgi:hypothetical protein
VYEALRYLVFVTLARNALGEFALCTELEFAELLLLHLRCACRKELLLDLDLLHFFAQPLVLL